MREVFEEKVRTLHVGPERPRSIVQLQRGHCAMRMQEVSWGAAALQQESWSCGVRIQVDRPGTYDTFAIVTRAEGDTRWFGERLADSEHESIDLVLLDLETFDAERHRRLTSAEVGPTHAFARRLAERRRPIWVRFVLVPGHTDDEEDIGKLAGLAAGRDLPRRGLAGLRRPSSIADPRSLSTEGRRPIWQVGCRILRIEAS